MKTKSTGRLALGGCYSYDQGKPISSTGTSETYACIQDKGLSIKVVNITTYRQKSASAYLVRELELHRKLYKANAQYFQELVDHTPLDSLFANKRCFIVVRSGSSLRLPAFVHSQYFNWQNYAWVFLRVARVLLFMHSQGILHRNIKPQNMAVDVQSRRAYLIDFQFAIEVQNYENIIVGTPKYMAPQLRQDKSVSKLDIKPQLTDVYSFGKTIFQVTSNLMPINDQQIIKSWIIDLATRCIAQTQSRPSMDWVVEAIIGRLQKRSSDELWKEIGISISKLCETRERPIARQCLKTLHKNLSALLGRLQC